MFKSLCKFLLGSTCVLEVRHTQPPCDNLVFHYASSTLRMRHRPPFQVGERIPLGNGLTVQVKRVIPDGERNEFFKPVPLVIADFEPPDKVGALTMEQLGFSHDEHQGRFRSRETAFDHQLSGI
jgi:hypothetical protein